MYSMPFAMNASTSVKVATNQNETLAILVFTIVGMEKILLFTEEVGFVEVNDLDQDKGGMNAHGHNIQAMRNQIK